MLTVYANIFKMTPQNVFPHYIYEVLFYNQNKRENVSCKKYF